MDTPSDRKKTENVPSRQLGAWLWPPRTRNWWVSNNIFWQPHCRARSLSQDCPHLLSQAERRQTVDTISAEAMGAVGKVWEKEWGGEDLTLSPGLCLWTPQAHGQVVPNNVTEKGKCLMLFPRGALDLFPMPHHIPDAHGRAQRPLLKKENKKKPCCWKERGRCRRLLGLSHMASVLYIDFPAAAWHSSRWESHPLSPLLQCTLFSVQGLSISHLVLRVLIDKTYLVKGDWCSGLMSLQIPTPTKTIWTEEEMYPSKYTWGLGIWQEVF